MSLPSQKQCFPAENIDTDCPYVFMLLLLDLSFRGLRGSPYLRPQLDC